MCVMKGAMDVDVREEGRGTWGVLLSLLFYAVVVVVDGDARHQQYCAWGMAFAECDVVFVDQRG